MDMGTCILKKKWKNLEEGKEYHIVQVWMILGKKYFILENETGRKVGVPEEEVSIKKFQQEKGD